MRKMGISNFTNLENNEIRLIAGEHDYDNEDTQEYPHQDENGGRYKLVTPLTYINLSNRPKPL